MVIVIAEPPPAAAAVLSVVELRRLFLGELGKKTKSAIGSGKHERDCKELLLRLKR